MVGKNNYQVKKEKQADKFYRYSIKRLSVGVASVAVAAGLLFTSDAAVVEVAAAETGNPSALAVPNEEDEEEKARRAAAAAAALEAEKAAAPVETPAEAPVAEPAAEPVAEKSEAEKPAEEKPAAPEKVEADKKAEEKPQADKKAEEAPKAEKAEKEAKAEKKAEEKAKDDKKSEARAGYYAADKDDKAGELKFFAAEEKKAKDTNEPAPTADLTFSLKAGTIEDKKPEEAVSNKASLPNGTKYEWVKKPQKGDKEAHVKVTYPDKSYDILTLPINTPDNVPAEAANGTELITGGGTSEADAIDATGQNPNATQIYRGQAWIENEPAFGDKDKGDVPAAGQKVYLQWKDGKGIVSPIFYTVVKPDGSFIFDLSRPVILADGSVTQYKLAGDAAFGVRTWASPMEGYSVVKSGDMYGARFQTRTDRTQENWDFTAGINRIVNGVIQYQRKPNIEGWLAKPEDQWVRANTPEGYWPDNGNYGVMRGKVWYEVNETNGGVTNEYLGQPGNGDIWATGMEVVGSYVNDHVARQFDAWKTANKGYTHDQFKVAQQQIIAEYEQQYGKGSAIAETVVGKVDKDGNFRIPFRGLYGVSRNRQNPIAQTSNIITDEEYGKVVKDEDVTHDNSRPWDGIVNLKARHINYDYSYVYPLSGNRDTWMKMYEDNMFQTSYSIGGQLNAGTDISGIQFALLAAQPVHDVTNYDTNAKFARPGDTAQSSTKGLHPSQPYKQRWFRNGKPVGEVTEFTTDEKGEYGSIPITVPNDLEDDVIYTSGIFASTNKANNLTDALYADSFMARPPVKKVNKDDEVKRGYVRVSFLPGNGGKFDGNNQEVYYDIMEGKTIQEAIADSKGSAAPLVIPNVTPNDPAKPFKGWKENSNNGNTKVYAKDLADYTTPLEAGKPVTFVAEYDKVEEKDDYAPVYNPVQAEVGKEATSTLKFVDKAGQDTAKPAGAKFALGENAPEGSTVDPDTGVVKYTPKAADAATTVDVPVVVTYKDGSKDNTNAPIHVAEQDKIKDATDPNSPVPEGYVRLKFNADTKDGSVTGKFADNSKVKAFDVLKGTKFNDPAIQEKFDAVVPTNPVADNPAKKWSAWEPIFDNELVKDTPIEEGLTGDTREYHSVYEDKRFNEDNVGIAKVEIVKDPTKKAYTEGKEGDNKLDPAGTQVKLTDANGVEKVVEPKDFGKYGIKVGLKDVPNYTPDTPLTKKDHDGKKVEVTVPGKTGELKAESKAPITVKQQDKDALEPSYEPTEANVGQAAKSKAPSFKDSANQPADKPADATFALGEGAPKGAKVDPKTGEVSYTPQAADEGKAVKVPVVVTYGDKTTDQTEASFNVAQRPDVIEATDPNEEVPQGYHKVTLKAGEGTQVPEKVLHVRDGKGIPADKYPAATIDPAKANDYKEPITWSVAPNTAITKDEVIVANATKKTDAEKNDPQAKDQTVKVGQTPKAEDSIANLTDLPKGTKVAYKEPVNTSTPGDKKATVVVTYPDGTTDEVPATVKVKDLTDAEKNDPQAKDQTVKVGETPKAEDSIANLKDLPQGTKVAFKEPVDTKTPGEKQATVVVTYPDGTTDEVPAKVQVKDLTDAEKNDPQAKDQTVKVGQTPKAEDSIANLKDLPQGTKVAYKEPVNTSTPGDQKATVVVTYPDGSTDEVPVTVKVKDLTDAEKNDPQAKDQTVKVGQTPKAEDSIANLKDLPQGTKVAYKEPVNTSTPGDQKATVVVTYPDGSTDEVPVTVKVKDLTDAEKNEPQAKDQTVKVGETPKAEDSIANLKDLPQGTKVAFKEPVDTKTSGDKPATVVVTYPDGSTDEVPVTVKVNDLTDAEKNDPQGQDINTKVGETPNAKDGIKDADKLPQGTKFDFKEPVDTKTPGDKPATVVVTYPDGTKDEVPVTVKVNDLTDAEKNNPQGQDINTKVGGTPNAKDGIKDADKLPQGTKFEFETPVDTKTPGDKPAKVVVTYPDGTKDEVPVTVKVSENPTQAETTNPTVPAKTEVENKDSLTPEEKDKVKKAVEDANKDKFPAPKDGQNPTAVTVDDKGNATITYPDGSKDTIPGTDLVVERPKTTVEGTPKPVKATDEPQDTGLVVKNQDDKTPTKVTAKDEDGNDVPVTVDPETGKVSVTPGTKVDGPITVTVEDKDLPEGKQTFEVPVEGHEKGRDDNNSGKTQADLTDPTVPAKTEVENKDSLTPEEKDKVKKAIEDANKDKFPAAKEGQKPTAVTVDDKGNATITYPDGSKDTIPGTDLVVERPKTTVEGTPKPVKPTKDPQDTGLVVKNQDDKTPTKVTAKDEDGNDVPVTVDPETGKVSVTPGTKVDGPITVTVEDKDLPNGKQTFEVPVEGHEKGRDDNNSGKTQADLTDPTKPAKTEVEDKTNLTPEEKAKVKKAVEDANKDKFPAPAEGQNPTTVEVGPDGTATIIYPDGSKDTIPGTDLVVERPKTTVEGTPKTVKPTNDPQDTGLVVKNKDDKTPTKVTAKDEDGQDVPVTVDPETGKVSVTPGTKVDGPITVTVEDKDLPEGKQTFEVPVEGHEKGNDDNNSGKTQADLTDPTVPAEKTPVADKNNLTDDEKAQVKKAIEDANKDKFPAAKEGQNPTKVEIGKDGTATITYPDGSKDTIPGTDLVREKTNVDDSAVKEVNPTDEKQGTGIKVNNAGKETKVTAKDEDGKDVSVVINPETGEVEVTPGKDVDGPITVTVTDPDLPGGKQEVTVPVKGHEAGRDDNGSDQSAKPTIEAIHEGDEIVEGNGVPDAKIVVKDKDGNVIGETTVDGIGNWSVKVPANKLFAGDKVTVEQTEEGKKPAVETATVQKATGETTRKGDPAVAYPIESHPVVKHVGESLTADDITKAIVVVGVPEGSYKVTINEGQSLPSTDKVGDTIIDVTVTLPDGTTEAAQVWVIVKAKGGAAPDYKKPTTVDDSQVKEVNPTNDQQGTGIKVNNPDKDTKVTAKDEDGKDIPVVINPTTGEVEVTPGTDVDGPITVTITDPELPGGKKEVVVPVKGHAAGRDDNGSDKVVAPSNTVKPAQPATPVAKPAAPQKAAQGTVKVDQKAPSALPKASQAGQGHAKAAKTKTKLPQTGALVGLTSGLALALVGAGSLLALGKGKKKD